MSAGKYLISIFCPHCHRYTALSEVLVSVGHGVNERSVSSRWVSGLGSIWWMGFCNYCNNPSLVLNGGEKVYPHPLPEPTSEDVPESIRADLDEAKTCLSVQAYRAAAVMARRAMQNAAIEKGAKQSGNLFSQINELRDKGHITEDLKKWASVVRLVGNDAAHPGDVVVDAESAKEIVELAEQFMQVVFVTPARAKKTMDRRNENKQK